MNIFKGKLTYTLSAAIVLAGVYGLYSTGVSSADAWMLIWLGGAVFGLRRAM